MNRKRSPLQPFVLENVRRSPRRKGVKEKEKGRRKLDFNKDSKKMTRSILQGFITYVDVKFQTKAEAIKKRIVTLGGVVEEFLDKKINLIITCQNITDYTDKHGYVLPSVPSPMSATQPSPLQIFSNKQSYGHSPLSTDSPQNSVEVGKKERLSNEFSLGKKLISRALTNKKDAGTPNICQRAKNLNARLLSVDEFYKRFMQNKNSSSHISSLKEKPLHNLKKPTTTRTVAEVQVIKLTEPFFKIEDIKRCFRPLTYETKSWPRIYEDTSLYQSPFELPKEKKHNKSKTINDAECEIGDDETISMADKSEKMCDNEEEEVKAKPVSPVPKPSTAKKKKTPKKNVEKPGYCDICTVRYKDLQKHLKNDMHRKFVTNKSNFKELDDLINECTHFDTLIDDLKGAAKLKEYSRNFNSSIKEEEENNVTKVLPTLPSDCEKDMPEKCSQHDGDILHDRKQQKRTSLVPCFLGFENGHPVHCNPHECNNSHEVDSEDDNLTTKNVPGNTIISDNLAGNVVINSPEKSTSKAGKLIKHSQNHYEKDNQRDTSNQTDSKRTALYSPAKVLISTADQLGCISPCKVNLECINAVKDEDSVFVTPAMVSTPIKQKGLSDSVTSTTNNKIILASPISKCCSISSVTVIQSAVDTATIKPEVIIDINSNCQIDAEALDLCSSGKEAQVLILPPKLAQTPPSPDGNVILKTKRKRRKQRRRTLSSSPQNQSIREIDERESDAVYLDTDYKQIIEEEVQRNHTIREDHVDLTLLDSSSAIPKPDEEEFYRTLPNVAANAADADGKCEEEIGDILPDKRKPSNSRRRRVIMLESDPEVVFSVGNDDPVLQKLLSPYKSSTREQLDGSSISNNAIHTQAINVKNKKAHNASPGDIDKIDNETLHLQHDQHRTNPLLPIIDTTNISIPGGLPDTLRQSLSHQENVSACNINDCEERKEPCSLLSSQNAELIQIQKTPTKSMSIAFSDDEYADHHAIVASISAGLKFEEFQGVDDISVAILKHGSTPDSSRKLLRKTTPVRTERRISINTPKSDRLVSPNSKLTTNRRRNSSSTVEDIEHSKSPTIVSCKRNLRSMNTPPRRRGAFNDAMNQLSKYSPDTHKLKSISRCYNPKKRSTTSTSSCENWCRKRSRTNSNSNTSVADSGREIPSLHRELDAIQDNEKPGLMDEQMTVELEDDVFSHNKSTDKKDQTIVNVQGKNSEISTENSHFANSIYDDNYNSVRQRCRNTPSLQDLKIIQGFIYDRIKNNPRRSSSAASQSFSRSSSRASSPSRGDKQKQKAAEPKSSSRRPPENGSTVVDTITSTNIDRKSKQLQEMEKQKNRTSPRKKPKKSSTTSAQESDSDGTILNLPRKSPRKHSMVIKNSIIKTEKKNSKTSSSSSLKKPSPFANIYKTNKKKKTKITNSSFQVFDFSDNDIAENTSPLSQLKKNKNTPKTNEFDNLLSPDTTPIPNCRGKSYRKSIKTKSPLGSKIVLVNTNNQWTVDVDRSSNSFVYDDTDQYDDDDDDDDYSRRTYPKRKSKR